MNTLISALAVGQNFQPYHATFSMQRLFQANSSLLHYIDFE